MLDNLTWMLKSAAAAMDMVLEYKNSRDRCSPTKIQKSQDNPKRLVWQHIYQMCYSTELFKTLQVFKALSYLLSVMSLTAL